MTGDKNVRVLKAALLSAPRINKRTELKNKLTAVPRIPNRPGIRFFLLLVTVYSSPLCYSKKRICNGKWIIIQVNSSITHIIVAVLKSIFAGFSKDFLWNVLRNDIVYRNERDRVVV